MFDIGFFELLLIGVVALLVIGPERLPTVARQAGAWMGRARRFVRSVKDDIDREIQAEEYKRLLEEQNIAKPVHEIIEETRDDLRDIGQQTREAVESVAADKGDAEASAPAEAGQKPEGDTSKT